jgi:hypothetical protein
MDVIPLRSIFRSSYLCVNIYYRFGLKNFFQVDGGSENANKTVLAMCELLTQRGICETLVLTRLPTGHTHSDIDGTFGHLWNFIKGRT